MHLVPVNVASIRIGQPLPFALRDEGGVLLAHKGYVVTSRKELDLVIGRGSNLFIDVAESENHHRAYVGKLHHMVRQDRPLRQIAGAQILASDLDSHRNTAGSGEPDWLELQNQAHAMLRDSNPASFRERLDKLQALLGGHSRSNPDGALLALIHLASSELQRYSATHAMLVSVMCGVAAREVLKWPAALELSLCKAALTMNVGMTELQDRLALQKEAPSAEQQVQIEQHPVRAVRLLEQLGVTEPHWLEAVRDHRNKTPGPLTGRSEGQRMARLIQRADVFAARLAPRAARLPESPTSTMQSSYFDENGQIDEAGAALIKAVGIYSPGSYVRLASNEIAVVIKRGANTTTPRVAVLINRSGMPTGELIARDTSQPEFRIASSVAHRDVKVQINLERLLALVRAPAAERLW